MEKIGFTLIGQDNDSFFLEHETQLIESTCRECGCLLDFVNYFNPSFRIKKKTYDFSATYDLRYIVSLKFKEFCVREGYKNIKFKSFEREPGFFQFLPCEIVEFDSERRKTEFIDYCEVCNNYKEVIGAIPAFLKIGTKKLTDGFYRTDLLFGVKNRKQPLIIVAPETYEKLKREKFKGLVFDRIEP